MTAECSSGASCAVARLAPSGCEYSLAEPTSSGSVQPSTCKQRDGESERRTQKKKQKERKSENTQPRASRQLAMPALHATWQARAARDKADGRDGARDERTAA